MGFRMKSVALIHTVQSVMGTFEEKLRAGVSQEIKVYNMLDEYLARHPKEVGEFTVENRNRLFMDIKAQEMTGADIIVLTCSTLTPTVDLVKPFVKVPVVAIDDAMGRKGVSLGSRILILATAESTLEPTKQKLKKEAKKAGCNVELSWKVLTEAYDAMLSLDMQKHDAILKKYAEEIHGYDCVILAQASMAHMEEEIQLISGCTVLSSPKLCIEEVDNILKGN